jgi:hypothetical protein
MSNNTLSNQLKYPKEVFGKIFVLNREVKDIFRGWILIEGNFSQFCKILEEEIENEWDLKKLENFKIYFIDTSINQLVEIKDSKMLNALRRKEKAFIVLIEKRHFITEIKEFEPLYHWYIESLNNYDF